MLISEFGFRACSSVNGTLSFVATHDALGVPAADALDLAREVWGAASDQPIFAINTDDTAEAGFGSAVPVASSAHDQNVVVPDYQGSVVGAGEFITILSRQLEEQV